MTGQHYLRARYYNPVLGRFLQEDVYRGDGLNLYAYCENNPVTYYDPTGEIKKRTEYLGKTPGINSKTGREVLNRYLNIEGGLDLSGLDSDLISDIMNNGFSKRKITNELKDKILFRSTDDQYYPLSEA